MQFVLPTYPPIQVDTEGQLFVGMRKATYEAERQGRASSKAYFYISPDEEIALVQEFNKDRAIGGDGKITEASGGTAFGYPIRVWGKITPDMLRS